MLTPEQLLQPRYKVIADYPNSDYTVGYVIQPDEENRRYIIYWKGETVASHPLMRDKTTVTFYESYPAIFERLEWWRDRFPSDMPAYVTFLTDTWLPDYDKYEPAKVHSFEQDTVKVIKLGKILNLPLWCFLPATAEEYAAYQNKSR